LIDILLSNPLDRSNCYIEIRCGAGGLESMDWVSLLGKMYENWARIRNFDVEMVEMSRTGSIGFHKIVMKIKGMNSYGWCKGETGIHRLVRLSPFDSQGKRHTSFASVCVSPINEQSLTQFTIPTNELKIETFRASGNNTF
jgi:peptide chain release factor 2